MQEEKTYDQLITRELVYFVGFTVLAIASPIAAFFIPYIPEKETFITWFPRSGSVMVVFGLLAEARAINCFFILNPSGLLAMKGITEAREKYEKYPTVLNIISFAIVALGTLIWGYGDIPFKQ